MRFLKTKLLALAALMLCMSVFCASAYASEAGGEPLNVTAAWVDGELLRINVTDAKGADSALALRLSDYVSSSENKEYISIQAADLSGNKSGVIEIKNPYYNSEAAPEETPAPQEQPSPAAAPEATDKQPESSESAVLSGEKPLTPDGAGMVADNATDGDGKEFFTISTEDGSVFYLIVDRQKNADNVYLLNTVTEDDLIALAKENGRELATQGGASAIPVPEQAQTPAPEPEQTQKPKPPAEKPAKSDTGMYVLIGIIVVIAGGAGYYLKIVKGRKSGDYHDDESDEDKYGYNDDYQDDEEDEDDTEDGGDKA